MRDVGERAAMHEGRVVLQRLHQVWLHGILEKHRHGAGGLEVAGIDRTLVAPVGDDDVSKPLLKVCEVGRKAENCHHLGGDGDVKAGFAGKAVGDSAE